MVIDILIVLIIISCALYFRELEKTLLSICFIEIVLRIITIIKSYFLCGCTDFLDDLIPDSLSDIFFKYQNGIIRDFVIVLYLLLYLVIAYYFIKLFVDKFNDKKK